MALRPRVSQNSLIESQSVPCHFRVGQNRSTRFLPRRGQAKKLSGAMGQISFVLIGLCSLWVTGPDE